MSIYFEMGAIVQDTTVIGQVSAAPINANVEFAKHGRAGALNNSFIAALSQRPTIDISSTDIKGMLDFTGTKGLDIVTNPVDLYYLPIADGGTVATTGAVKASVNAGMMIPTQLSMGNEQVATINSTLYIKGDGTNEPVVYSTGQTEPTATEADRMYTFAKFNYNSIDYDIEDLTLNFGVKPIVKGGQGTGYPSYIAYNQQLTSLSFTTNDYTQLSTVTPTGGLIDETLIIYLARLEHGGVRYADVETEHIKITIGNGSIRQDSIPNSYRETGLVPYTFEPFYDGVNSFMTIDTASAIT